MEIKFNKLEEEEERRIFSKWGKKHSEEGLLKILPPAKFVKYIGIDLMPDYLFIFIRTVSSLLVLLYFSSWELRELLYDATVFSCLNTPDFFFQHPIFSLSNTGEAPHLRDLSRPVQ